MQANKQMLGNFTSAASRRRDPKASRWWRLYFAIALLTATSSAAFGAKDSDSSGERPAAVTGTAEPSNSPVSTEREALRDRLAALNPFRAHFAQYVEGARGQVLEESTGELAMQRPYFRWQVDAPYPQVIVADGEQLSIYDPDLEQVILRDLETALADTPIALLTQSTLVLSDRFEVVMLAPGSSTEAEVFLLSPQDPNSLFQEVQLHFLDSTLKQLLIYDHLGQSTTVRFRPIAIDGALAPSLFQLELPDDVDVIEG